MHRCARPIIALSLLAVAVAATAGAPPRPAKRPAAPPIRWTGATSAIALSGRYASARLLVETPIPGGARDVTAETRFSVARPSVAVVRDGVLRPVADGKTVVTARWKGSVLSLPVTVVGAKPAAPRFVADVVPVLTKLGCNQGGCHGAAQGKGGFKLSLQGYDPESDIVSITRGAAGRRVSPSQPENSLLLRKPTMVVAHKGGKLLEPGSPHYRLLVDWIAAGMPGPKKDEPTVTRVEIAPAVRTAGIGSKQRFRVRARFSDNTERDITEEALFSGSNPAVADVQPDGNAQVVGKGEAAVLIRYRDRVSAATLISPFAKPLPAPTGKVVTPSEQIDRLIDRKLAGLGLVASPGCSDADFLRRVTLDLTGSLPTPDQARAFLADKTPDRREKLVDSLLNRPEFVDYWTLRWGDILRSTRTALNDRGLYAMNRWIRDSVAQNKPWDRMARELILARGSTYEDGPANYYRASPTPETLVETTSQVFLGVRIQCARCHNHPFEKWKQNQYYEMASFFTRVRSKPGEAADERVVFTGSTGDIANPRTKIVAVPTPLDAKPVPATFTGDRREALADWLTAKDNPFFAAAVVNRLWGHFFGQGIIDPVDDVRVTNPPTNPELLDWLATDFAKHGFDLKRTMRVIVLSKVYQRSAVPTRANVADTKYLSTFPFKRLGAEVLLDAVGAATGVPEKFGGYPAGTRAAELPDTTAQSYFLDLFGRPARNIVCQCERSDAPNLGQILHFMNGKGINDRLSAKDGRVSALVASGASNTDIVKELYLGALSRYPTLDEMLTASVDIHASPDRRQAVEDILWVLLNSKEFLFNH